MIAKDSRRYADPEYLLGETNVSLPCPWCEADTRVQGWIAMFGPGYGDSWTEHACLHCGQHYLVHDPEQADMAVRLLAEDDARSRTAQLTGEGGMALTTRFPAHSRADEPVEGLLVDEDLTRCVYCDTRTAPGDFPVCAPNRAEVCPHCGQRYAVADEQDDPILVELRLKPRD